MIEKNPREIKLMLDDQDNDLIILDVREKWEYDICHIDKSVLIPVSQITQRKDELNKSSIIIVVCHHGIRSRMVAKYLDGEGFEEVLNLTGGVDAWSKTVDESMKKYA